MTDARTTWDRFRDRRVAYNKLNWAIKKGRVKVKTTCDCCGRNPQPTKAGSRAVQCHHHNGYDKPLDVVWLCTKCHRAETPMANGERSASARLNDKMVMEIRSSAEPHLVLAERLGVSPTAIWRARRGITWSHLPCKAVPEKSLRGRCRYGRPRAMVSQAEKGDAT